MLRRFYCCVSHSFHLGVGKTHNDAASVRTTHPIPAACGLYYFEVKIISKGRDGYMGIGLTAQNFKANRLPGKLVRLNANVTHIIIFVII